MPTSATPITITKTRQWQGSLAPLPLKAEEKLPHGTLCFADAGGLGVSAPAGTFAGVVYHDHQGTFDATGAANSAVVGQRYTRGGFRFPVAGTPVVNGSAYADGNAGLTSVATANIRVGQFAEVHGSEATVDIDVAG